MITSYKELPLGKYLDICKVANDNELDDLTKQVKEIAILTDKTEDEVLVMPITEYASYAQRMTFLGEEHPKVQYRMSDRFCLGGKNYILSTDIRKITTAQYIDFQHYSKDLNNNIVELISCFLIPEGKEYNEGYDVLDVQHTIREHLMVTEAEEMTTFFFKKLRTSIRGIAIYLGWMAMKRRKKMPKKTLTLIQKLKQKTTSLEGGDGLLV